MVEQAVVVVILDYIVPSTKHVTSVNANTQQQPHKNLPLHRALWLLDPGERGIANLISEAV